MAIRNPFLLLPTFAFGLPAGGLHGRAPAVAPAECADFSRPPSAATAPGASAAPAAQANAGAAAPHLAAAPPLFGKIGDLPLVSGSPW